MSAIERRLTNLEKVRGDSEFVFVVLQPGLPFRRACEKYLAETPNALGPGGDPYDPETWHPTATIRYLVDMSDHRA